MSLASMMAASLHPAYDEEDLATAAVMLPTVAAFIRSSRAEEVAMKAVNDALVAGNMPMSYGDVVRCALAAVAFEAVRETRS